MVIIKMGSQEEDLEVAYWANNKEEARTFLYNEDYRYNKVSGFFNDAFDYCATIESVPSVFD